MPPRIPRPSRRALLPLTQASRSSPSPAIHALAAATAARCLSTTSSSKYALAAAARIAGLQPSPDYVPPTKPPSARPSETRKSQLIRTYTSLLRSAPLVLFFQHNNLTAIEWAAIRRELRIALQAVPTPASLADQPNIAEDIHLSVFRTRMFNVALKLVSFFDAEAAAKSNAATPSSPSRGPYVHDLSTAAYEAMKALEVPPDSAFAQLEPLMIGPLAGLVFPAVSPAHLAAALRVLAPGAPGTPFAPLPRKKNPGYYSAECQNGLAKLLLVGGRVEGGVFDVDGVRWVGGIEGGLDGLRSQLVGLLQSAGLGLTHTLEAGGKSLWLALEGRKTALEEEQGGGKKEEAA
ncbi:hypothetical protein ACRALDRAFT_1076358 [Sodiomyces alcalophilus JCM 7366]|uniref:mitochondrial 54S ribosomal protein uL10m n=1 Tax=Sodiomyces alcalophilus JCM 7366 TaxID=591952 RepID=UPI0039B546DE